MSTPEVDRQDYRPLVKYGIVWLMTAASIPLLAVPSLKWLGWTLLGLSAVALITRHRSQFTQHMLVLICILALLGLTPINTDISYSHMLYMGAILAITILGPYFFVRKFLGQKEVIVFPLGHDRKWYVYEIAYILFAGVVAYLLLPFYLSNTGSYHNWSVSLNTSQITRFFIGTNGLGIWDEIFFVGVCLALLKRHLPFWVANVVQATLWTTFLYELGFRGWGFAPIFFFALSQGYVFEKRKSLLYIISIHLTIDFVLFLTLIHLNHPEELRIFVTAPF